MKKSEKQNKTKHEFRKPEKRNYECHQLKSTYKKGLSLRNKMQYNL